MTAEVARLRAEEPEPEMSDLDVGGRPPPAAAPALGYSLVCNLDGNRQITVQCFVGEDEPDAAVNAKIDRVFRVVDRQKAKYEILEMEKELGEHEKGLRRLVDNLETLDQDFAKQMAQMDVQLVELQQRKAEITNVANEQAISRGRSPRLAGANKFSVENIEKAIKDTVAEKERKSADRDQSRDGVVKQRERFEEEIKRLQIQIAEKREFLIG